MNSSNFSTVNPATGEQIETFAFFTAQETEAVLVRAEKSFKSYGKLPVHQRARLLSQLATTLRKNKAQLAKVITMEMGKIHSEAEGEVEKCAWEADWYAEHGPQMFADAAAPSGRDELALSGLQTARRCVAAHERGENTEVHQCIGVHIPGNEREAGGSPPLRPCRLF
jgi:acyl-CoA reductase-like NAD-dependent aldehyde dehydrogenase